MSCDLYFFGFQSSQGDIGEKGPEGASGKDGARVSLLFVSHFVFKEGELALWNRILRSIGYLGKK